MLGKTIGIYNGKKYISIRITEDMLGFKLGSFVMTRLRHIYKKFNKKNKKQGKKNKLWDKK